MGTDGAELFSLSSTHLSIHRGLDLFTRRVMCLLRRCHVKRRSAFQQTGRDSGDCLAEDIGKHIVRFDVRSGQAVLGAVFLPGGEVGQFPVVAYQIPELAGVCRRDKAAGHQIMFENVGDPFGVLLIRFLPSDYLDVLRMSKNDVAG
jgi:hypothetical protein